MCAYGINHSSGTRVYSETEHHPVCKLFLEGEGRERCGEN